MNMFQFNFPSDISFYLFAVTHGVMAGAVTVHALLKKRDVRAAIGWIGLACLSPVIGPVLYYVLGINRVTRRASRLNRRVTPCPVAAAVAISELPDLAENLALIALVGERVTGRPLTPGNKLYAFWGADEAYPAMLRAIRGARQSVALSSYIFREDDVGEAFVGALVEAELRGAQIRVLIDGIGGGYIFSPIVWRLTREGIPVARFLHNWLPWRMSFLNMRSHKKVLVVDGKIGFTGGLNIGSENSSAPKQTEKVNDAHFCVEGPVVNQLMLTFAEDWNFTTGEVLEGDVWWPDLALVGPSLARGINSGPDEDIGNLEDVWATALASAKRRVRIVTPYFLPDQHLSSAIALAALRGVEVDVVIPERSDHVLVNSAMRAHLNFFGAPDVRFHLAPPPFDHSKLMTVDSHWCFIGSPNWDVRSTRLNFEFSLECYDKSTVFEIDRMIDMKIERSRQVSRDELAARPLAMQLRDAAARLLLPYL